MIATSLNTVNSTRIQQTNSSTEGRPSASGSSTGVCLSIKADTIFQIHADPSGGIFVRRRMDSVNWANWTQIQ